MWSCLAVGVGGFVGSVCRYLIGLIPFKTASGFPWKTFAINIVGAFLISVIVGLATKNKITNPQIILMLKVGFCGGFTTFSTFAFESADLMKNGNTLTALIYMISSMVLGVLAIYFGQIIIGK